MATSLIDSVIHWRKKLDKNLDEDTILNVIRKLSKIPITVEILEVTHIGKTIRQLSKRDDIVGEKAKAVLKKWRDAFAEQTVKESSKSSVSKKENINKSVSPGKNHDAFNEKTVHNKERSNHEYKHEKHSFHSSSQKNSLTNGSKDSHLSTSPSLYTYVKNERERESRAKYTDYDPHIDVSEGYNPECPELFPGEKSSQKVKKDVLDETWDSASLKISKSQKHKRKSDQDNTESLSKSKRIKTENSTISDFNEGYEPECPEIFPGEKSSQKIKKEVLDETRDSASLKNSKSQKHIRKSDEDTYTQSFSNSKKIKTENSPISDFYDKSRKSQEKKENHNFHKNNAKKESVCTVKSETIDTKNEKNKLSSDPKKSKSKNCDENSKQKNKSKTKLKINCSEEFTSSEVRFEDCLGFNDIVTMKKKKSSKSQTATKKDASKDSNKTSSKSTSSSSGHVKKSKGDSSSPPSSKTKIHVNVPKPNAPVPAEVDIISTLPEIQPNYQPLPQRSLDFYSPKKKEVLTNEEAIRFTSSRREKTAVYSGRKSFFAEVPTLLEFCIRCLIEHIDEIGYLGNHPYFLLKPVFERCTPTQLFNIENYNPYLLDDTNELWEIHCKRDYKLLKPAENETWRDLYLRAQDEREEKLKSLTANISASIAKSNPVRKVKMAFVDSIAKPPRDVARRQAKNGTAKPVKPIFVKGGSSSKVISKPAGGSSSVSASSSSTSSSGFSSSGNTSLTPKKPKVAPLMAKTLKSMKQCFRR